MVEENKENQYVVLARKYRPQNFEELLGQDALVQTLTNAIKNNRLHHAYILTGIRGVGKTTTSRIIAKALNCIGKDGHGGPTINPCGICENCKAIAAGRHIDVLELDAASRTGVDDIREILDGVRYKPTNARYKIYIIDEVHMLSKNAFNALLKTLEEPPAHVKFIFATTEIRKVPVTILSRCQRFDLQRLTIDCLIKLFCRILQEENLEADTEALQIIAKAADGSARDGLSLLDQAISLGEGKIKTKIVKEMIGLADRSQIFDLFECLIAGKTNETIQKLQEQYKNGANPTTILQDLINITHLLAKVKVLPKTIEDESLSESEKDFCNRCAPNISIAILSKIWQMMIKGIHELSIAPVQIDALEMILIRIAYSANLPSVKEILEDVKKNSKLSSATTTETQKKNNISSSYSNENFSNTVFTKFEEIVSFLEQNKKILMAYSLKNNISVSEFADGYIKMTIDDSINSDFILNLQKILQEASGKNWKIDMQRGVLGQTIADKENAKEEEERKSVLEYPLVKAILAEFKGAKLETVNRRISEEDEDEPQISETSDFYFDDDL